MRMFSLLPPQQNTLQQDEEGPPRHFYIQSLGQCRIRSLYQQRGYTRLFLFSLDSHYDYRSRQHE